MNIVQIKGSDNTLPMPKILENAKETILTTAKEMLITSDYNSFNIRDLSSKCKISIGTIYNYFPNKYELVSSIFFTDWSKALERMKDINTSFDSLNEKLFKVYEELELFLADYLIIFKQISANPYTTNTDSCLTYLYPLIDEILTFERAKGNITSNLPNKKLYKFIINNLVSLCNDKSLDFEEIFSLIKL